jgi:hypothetical protein
MSAIPASTEAFSERQMPRARRIVPPAIGRSGCSKVRSIARAKDKSYLMPIGGRAMALVKL